jgi:hypothetical protein
MTPNTPCPIAIGGCEKMLYDVRMGPQAVACDGRIYIVYQANESSPEAHPHVIAYDIAARNWSEPVRVGTVSHYDHHFAPVLWFDHERRIHVLYHCHVNPHQSVHIVSAEPLSIDRWQSAPEVAPSISYPRLMHLLDGRLLMYYRVEGHLGYWTYSISDDGGFSWVGPEIPPIDFDHDPVSETDRWAGSYHGVNVGPDGHSLHIGFVHWDEKRDENPFYGRKFGSTNRYHMYYACLDIESGELLSATGDRLTRPLNRRSAAVCRIWERGWRLTNMPAVVVDDTDSPTLLFAVAEDEPYDCAFYAMRHDNTARSDGAGWSRTRIAETNHTWSGCHLSSERESNVDSEAFVAYLVVGTEDGSALSYGGGEIQQWTAPGAEGPWEYRQSLVPEPGLLYNNPKPVEDEHGREMNGWLVMYGWEGPGSIQPVDTQRESQQNRGRAWLWRDGVWC